MNDNLTLATWNLARPESGRRRVALREHVEAVASDVWVFTECHDRFEIETASHSSEEHHEGDPKDGHRWVTIASCFPIEPLESSDPVRTAAARLRPAESEPFIVFGSVLPWIGSGWRGHPAARGVAFRKSLDAQEADWTRLRERYPTDEFFLLGDLNQDLVEPRFYGSVANRMALEGALERSGLTPLTAGEHDPVRRSSAPLASIDHVCARQDSRWTAIATSRWPDTPKPVRLLSDHFGLAVKLSSSRQKQDTTTHAVVARDTGDRLVLEAI